VGVFGFSISAFTEWGRRTDTSVLLPHYRFNCPRNLGVACVIQNVRIQQHLMIAGIGRGTTHAPPFRRLFHCLILQLTERKAQLARLR